MGMPSSPGSSKVARGARPGTPSAATNVSRSIASLSSWRTSALSSGPPERTGTSPNRPEAGSKRRLLRGSFTRCGEGRSANVPPSTRSDVARRESADRIRRRGTRKQQLLRVAVSSSGETMSRLSLTSPPGSGVGGERAASPGRCGGSPFAAGRASESRSGRGATRLISITRSVIATMSSIAPRLSLRLFLLRLAESRFRSRATCSAVILRPSGQFPDARRKM